MQNTIYRVGRGLAPAVNSPQPPRRGQSSPNSGTLRREQAPALLYYNRHFPYQGNHPALPAGIRNYTVGNGLDRFEIFIQITGERSSPLRA